MPTKLSDQSLDELMKARQQIEAEIQKRKQVAGSRSLVIAHTQGTTRATQSAPSSEEIVSPADLQQKYKEQIQNLYVRSDPIDAFYYLYPLAPLDGRGASVSYTGDRRADTDTFTVRGFTSYVLARDFLEPQDRSPTGPLTLTGYAFAPFLFLNGTLREPRPRSERSALQAGLDTQFEFWRGGIFSTQNVGIRPYYQTDFRGFGDIAGVTALWEPYKLDWHLGGRADIAAPKFIGFYWRAVAEANIFHVGNAGLSNFEPDTTYSWLGGTLQLRSVFFENMPDVPSWLCGRVYGNASYERFWNASSSRDVEDFEAELGYILNSAPTPSNRACVASPGEFDPSKYRGKSSLSFVYNKGTDRSTLEKRDQFKVQLSFQY
jgi:hypothetical protein